MWKRVISTLKTNLTPLCRIASPPPLPTRGDSQQKKKKGDGEKKTVADAFDEIHPLRRSARHPPRVPTGEEGEMCFGTHESGRREKSTETHSDQIGNWVVNRKKKKHDRTPPVSSHIVSVGGRESLALLRFFKSPRRWGCVWQRYTYCKCTSQCQNSQEKSRMADYITDIH